MISFRPFQRKKPEPVDRKRSMVAVPVVNPGVTSKETAPGRLLLTVRLERGTGFLARFKPPGMERCINLDELGTFVFGKIDGKRTTKDIIEAFATQYRVNRREAELSCVEFLKSLLSRRVISVIVDRRRQEQDVRHK